jgi:hypothetical protein
VVRCLPNIILRRSTETYRDRTSLEVSHGYHNKKVDSRPQIHCKSMHYILLGQQIQCATRTRATNLLVQPNFNRILLARLDFFLSQNEQKKKKGICLHLRLERASRVENSFVLLWKAEIQQRTSNMVIVYHNETPKQFIIIF